MPYTVYNMLFLVLKRGPMKKVFLSFFVLVVFISCSNNADSNAPYRMASESAPVPAMEAKKSSLPEMDSTVNPRAESVVVQRKRILNAYLEMRVQDVTATEKELTRRTIAAGGWIVSSSFYLDELTLAVKIPADKYDSFLSDSEILGEIESKSVSSDDVTEYYFDLKNRIKNKKILQNRFREYLEKADSMEDILAVERQLNDVTTEIEKLEGSFRGLNRDIDYSTITFQLSPSVTETVSRGIPSFSRTFSTLGYKILSFFYYLFFGVIYLVVFGVPLVLVMGLIYILGWGKIGLIRKFFRKLRK